MGAADAGGCVFQPHPVIARRMFSSESRRGRLRLACRGRTGARTFAVSSALATFRGEPANRVLASLRDTRKNVRGDEAQDLFLRVDDAPLPARVCGGAADLPLLRRPQEAARSEKRSRATTNTVTPSSRSRAGRRVLVTDVEERSALAVCRGLVRSGYSVTGVAGARPAPGHWSRACSRRETLPDPRHDPSGFLAGLETVLRREEHVALVPSVDVSTFVVSENRCRLLPLTAIGLPAPDAVRASLDKVRLLDVAEAAGLTPPPSIVCDDEAGARVAIRQVGLPVVVKPAASFVPIRASFRQQPVVLVERAEALAEALTSIGRPFIVQRFEEAQRVVSCAGLVTSSGLIASVVVRWRRRWPPRTGSAAYCETIEPPPRLLSRAESVVERLGYRGIFELELLERAGGRYSAIDLNPRPFGWLTLAMRAGVNLPALYCDSILGGSPASVTARPGVRYRWEDGDLRHVLTRLRSTRSPAPLAALKPVRGTAHAFFERTDPGPLPAQAVLLLRSYRRRRGSVGSPSPGETERFWRPSEDRTGERRSTEPGADHEAHHRSEGADGRGTEEVEAFD
jgi:predicted ATP-grasp superfamily ATP-dependent carboligase